MNIKLFVISILILIVVLSITIVIFITKSNEITVTVMKIENDILTVQDNHNIIYTFNNVKNTLNVGDTIKLEYIGNLDKNKEVQNNKVLAYKIVAAANDQDKIISNYQDNGIFSDYYKFAKEKLDTMTLDEKIAQVLLVRYPDNNGDLLLKKYQFGGYVFFEKDFKDKTEVEIKNMINSLQTLAKIPILTATDEEGGSVVRVSSNANLAIEEFKSPRELYISGGFEAIKMDTVQKSISLYNLGINLNLAPVVDVSTDSSDYMYRRSLGEDTKTTAKYAKTVIKTSSGYGVSYTLKHFPGYGNNDDTHTGKVVDNRSYDEIVKNDLPPFEAGIEAGAEAILVSHNTVINIDSSNPASLSPSIHNLLRNKLGFTGIIITDDLAMNAISSVDDAVVKALLAGNDLIITTDYEQSINSIKKALQNKIIDVKLINKLAFRVLSWKYYKGLIIEN